MREKEVILIRKQNTPFVVNFPIDGRIKKYEWRGTKGKLYDEKAIPFEVYEWLALYTTTFQDGCLIIKETDDKEIKEIKENIENIAQIEKAIITQSEVEQMLNNGNHLVLKKALNELIKDLSDDVANNVKQYIVNVASDLGVDSSAKRKVLAEWAGLDYENADLIFDKELQKEYEK